jgi:hypothetical protein
MRRANVVVAVSIMAISAWGCTFSPGSGGNGPDGGNHGIPGSGTTGSGFGGSTGSGTGSGGSRGPSVDGNNCGLQTIPIENIPPDLLIILDKSGSMGELADGTKCAAGAACQSKWLDMTAAINQVVGQTQATIRWGLKYFANNDTCGVNDGAAVPVGPNNGMAIANSIAMTTPNGSTPTRLAETSGAAYLMGVTDPNPKYILLATDGLPNCAPRVRDTSQEDAMGAEQAVAAAAAAGIPTFVVGVGSIPDAATTLTQMAINGGRPQMAAPRYYPVSNTADLVSVLGTIGGQIASCTFALGQVPPDPSNIAVNADGKRVPKDTTHMNGWDYGTGMRSVELFGTWCDQIKSKAIKNVQAIFGCPGVVIP